MDTIQNKEKRNLSDEHKQHITKSMTGIKRNINSDFSMWKRGEISQMEYQNRLAIKNGYKNFTDYMNYINHKSGRNKLMSDSKDSPSYLGIHIAERILSKIFEDVTRMPSNNKGYDFICKKGHKIDVKSACLSDNKWQFNLNGNKIANYFLFLAFDNREDLEPKHIWIIKNDNINVKSKTITNNNKSINKWSNYEKTDKLKELQKYCDILKIKT